MDKRFIVYGRRSCPYCVKAEALLKERTQEFDFVDLEGDPRTLNEVKSLVSWPTVPVVVVRTSEGRLRLVGGYSELESYLGA